MKANNNSRNSTKEKSPDSSYTSSTPVTREATTVPSTASTFQGLFPTASTSSSTPDGEMKPFTAAEERCKFVERKRRREFNQAKKRKESGTNSTHSSVIGKWEDNSKKGSSVAAVVSTRPPSQNTNSTTTQAGGLTSKTMQRVNLLNQAAKVTGLRAEAPTKKPHQGSTFVKSPSGATQASAALQHSTGYSTSGSDTCSSPPQRRVPGQLVRLFPSAGDSTRDDLEPGANSNSAAIWSMLSQLTCAETCKLLTASCCYVSLCLCCCRKSVGRLADETHNQGGRVMPQELGSANMVPPSIINMS